MTAVKAVIAGAGLGLALVWAVPAQAASVSADKGPDCLAPSGFVARMVCGDPALTEREQALQSAWKSFIDQYVEGGGQGEATDLSGFDAEQAAWRARLERCRSKACLRRLYDQRIKDVTVDY